MSRDQDELGAPPELPSVEKGPRAPDQQAWTGTGTPRSADDGVQEQARSAIARRTMTSIPRSPSAPRQARIPRMRTRSRSIAAEVVVQVVPRRATRTRTVRPWRRWTSCLAGTHRAEWNADRAAYGAGSRTCRRV